METVKLEDLKVGKIPYGRYAELKNNMSLLPDGEALKVPSPEGEDVGIFAQKLRMACRQGRTPHFSVCVRVDRLSNVVYIWRKA